MRKTQRLLSLPWGFAPNPFLIRDEFELEHGLGTDEVEGKSMAAWKGGTTPFPMNPFYTGML